MSDVSPVEPGRRPWSLVIAAAATLLVGIALIAVAVAVMVTRMALFSLGVGVMLLIYGALVVLIGWAAWRRARLAFGPLVAGALLHLLVTLNLARGSLAPLFFGLAVVPLATLVCAFLPDTRRALGWTALPKMPSDK